MIFAREGKLDGAIDHFRRALEKNPEDAGERANMAVTSAKQGDLEGAKKAFQEALRIQPDFAKRMRDWRGP
jgi:Flp pilus assembly protein TadD